MTTFRARLPMHQHFTKRKGRNVASCVLQCAQVHQAVSMGLPLHKKKTRTVQSDASEQRYLLFRRRLTHPSCPRTCLVHRPRHKMQLVATFLFSCKASMPRQSCTERRHLVAFPQFELVGFEGSSGGFSAAVLGVQT